MSYKLTFNLDNATLGDLVSFIEAAQDLGAPDSARLHFDGNQVSVDIGGSSRPAAEASTPQRESAGFVAEDLGGTVEDTFRKLRQEPIVQDFLNTLRDVGDNLNRPPRTGR